MNNPKFDLSGKVAIITGGNGGLGLGIAKGLAMAGAHIAIVGRKQEKIDHAVAQLKDSGAEAFGIPCDVGKEDDVNHMVATTADHFGRIDILFNNAAISWGIRTEEMTLDEWNNFITNNLTSTFLTCKACFPHMVEAGGGKIVNVGSVITKLGFGKLSHYAAAKGGMDHMTQSLKPRWPAKRTTRKNPPVRHSGQRGTFWTRTERPGSSRWAQNRASFRCRPALGAPR